MSTFAFTVCFAVWMLNGVLVTYLIDNQVFNWTGSEMGILVGVPVLTGATMRLPFGILTDRFGGRTVFTALMVLAAIPLFLLSQVTSFWGFLLCSLGFGLAGAGFSVGIAFTSVWFPKQWQGTALGIFGAGNAGSAITTLVAPTLLKHLTGGGAGDLERWRLLPQIYAAFLLFTAVCFFLGTENRRPEDATGKTVLKSFALLKIVRVWRFGLYYFLVFGGFVALAQWLVPYYVNVYSMSIVTAGLVTSIFSLPSGVVRALGGYLSDRFGARVVLYWVLAVTAVCCFLLVFPKMDIQSAGPGVMAVRAGAVTSVSDTEIRVGNDVYPLKGKDTGTTARYSETDLVILPEATSWQTPVVRVDDQVTKKQVLARGVTHIYFQANVWIFTVLVFIVGIAMGIGKAAVYKFIPDYFPSDVGAVGGLVGVIGGLGGFVCPILFGFLLEKLGLWTTTWMFLLGVTLACMAWLHLVVKRIEHPV